LQQTHYDYRPNNLEVAHGMSAKFGFWTFHKLKKKRKNFDLIDFWLPCS